MITACRKLPFPFTQRYCFCTTTGREDGPYLFYQISLNVFPELLTLLADAKKKTSTFVPLTSVHALQMLLKRGIRSLIEATN